MLPGLIELSLLDRNQGHDGVAQHAHQRDGSVTQQRRLNLRGRTFEIAAEVAGKPERGPRQRIPGRRLVDFQRHCPGPGLAHRPDALESEGRLQQRRRGLW